MGCCSVCTLSGCISMARPHSLHAHTFWYDLSSSSFVLICSRSRTHSHAPRDAHALFV